MARAVKGDPVKDVIMEASSSAFHIAVKSYFKLCELDKQNMPKNMTHEAHIKTIRRVGQAIKMLENIRDIHKRWLTVTTKKSSVLRDTTVTYVK